MRTGVLLLLFAPVPCGCGPAHASEPWSDVPVFVEQTLSADEGDAGAGETIEARHLRSRLAGEVLEVDVSDFNGLFGHSLVIRLEPLADGMLRARAWACWSTDVGASGGGPYDDLHGVVRVEAREAGDGRPLRLAFRLSGITGGAERLREGTWYRRAIEVSSYPDPVLLRGRVEVPLDEVDWTPLVRGPTPPASSAPSASSSLRAVTLRWSNGELRARGWLDRQGRRQGTWTTWYPSGHRQSTCEFLAGVRDGRWSSWRDGGTPCEEGRFVAGLREGEWIEHSYSQHAPTTRTGRYVANRKEGEWIERWDDGWIASRGACVEGRKTGTWTRWWRNGARSSESRYENGLAVGETHYWNEDGSPHTLGSPR